MRVGRVLTWTVRIIVAMLVVLTALWLALGWWISSGRTARHTSRGHFDHTVAPEVTFPQRPVPLEILTRAPKNVLYFYNGGRAFKGISDDIHLKMSTLVAIRIRKSYKFVDRADDEELQQALQYATVVTNIADTDAAEAALEAEVIHYFASWVKAGKDERETGERRDKAVWYAAGSLACEDIGELVGRPDLEAELKAKYEILAVQTRYPAFGLGGMDTSTARRHAIEIGIPGKELGEDTLRSWVRERLAGDEKNVRKAAVAGISQADLFGVASLDVKPEELAGKLASVSTVAEWAPLEGPVLRAFLKGPPEVRHNEIGPGPLKQRLAEMRKELAGAVEGMIRRAPDAELSKRAVLVLGVGQTPQSTAALLRLVADGSDVVSAICVQELKAYCHQSDETDLFLTYLREHSVNANWIALLDVPARGRAPKAQPFLIEVVQSDKPDAARIAALNCVTHYPSSEWTGEIAKVMAVERSAPVKAKMAELLGERAARSTVTLKESLAAAGKDRAVRDAVLLAMVDPNDLSDESIRILEEEKRLTQRQDVRENIDALLELHKKIQEWPQTRSENEARGISAWVEDVEKRVAAKQAQGMTHKDRDLLVREIAGLSRTLADELESAKRQPGTPPNALVKAIREKHLQQRLKESEKICNGIRLLD